MDVGEVRNRTLSSPAGFLIQCKLRQMESHMLALDFKPIGLASVEAPDETQDLIRVQAGKWWPRLLWETSSQPVKSGPALPPVHLSGKPPQLLWGRRGRV